MEELLDANLVLEKELYLKMLKKIKNFTTEQEAENIILDLRKKNIKQN